MKYKFCSIRINVTKYDVTFAIKGILTFKISMATPLVQMDKNLSNNYLMTRKIQKIFFDFTAHVTPTDLA